VVVASGLLLPRDAMVAVLTICCYDAVRHVCGQSIVYRPRSPAQVVTLPCHVLVFAVLSLLYYYM